MPSDYGNRYFPHSQLHLPSQTADATEWERRYPFAPSSVRGDQAFWPQSAFPDWETAYEKFGEEFANAQFERLRIKNRRFDYYIQTAALNDGVLIGDNDLSDSDLAQWLGATGDASVLRQRSYFLQAVLSLAGVEIAVPELSEHGAQELSTVKTKYGEELEDYRSYVAELIGGSWDVVKSASSFEELQTWAQFLATTKIQPALRRLEAAIRNGDRNLLAGIGEGAIAQVPRIVSGNIQGSATSLTVVALEQALQALAPRLADSIRERRVLQSTFGLSYLYRLKKTSIR